MTVGELRSALVGVPDDTAVLVDDLLVDTAGNTRPEFLDVVSATLSDPFPLGSPDGPIVRTFQIVVEDASVCAIGKPVSA